MTFRGLLANSGSLIIQTPFELDVKIGTVVVVGLKRHGISTQEPDSAVMLLGIVAVTSRLAAAPATGTRA